MTVDLSQPGAALTRAGQAELERIAEDEQQAEFRRERALRGLGLALQECHHSRTAFPEVLQIISDELWRWNSHWGCEFVTAAVNTAIKK
jgi:hypothetical protein